MKTILTMNALVVWMVSSVLLRVVSIFIPGVYVASIFSAAIFLLLWVVLTFAIEVIFRPIGSVTSGCLGLFVEGIVIYIISIFIPGVSISGVFVALILVLVLGMVQNLVIG